MKNMWTTENMLLDPSQAMELSLRNIRLGQPQKGLSI